MGFPSWATFLGAQVVWHHHESHEGYGLQLLYSKWLIITMVSKPPQKIGLWDPFQMAELYGL